jgi:hypothetical protein
LKFAMQRALTNAFEALARVCGQAIVYKAGAISVSIPDAVLGSSLHESEQATGAVIRVKSTDWLIDPAKLVHNNQAIEPTPGHRIEHTVNGVKRTYEVNPIGSNPCWRFSEPSRDRYRIHTREIANA